MLKKLLNCWKFSGSFFLTSYGCQRPQGRLGIVNMGPQVLAHDQSRPWSRPTPGCPPWPSGRPCWCGRIKIQKVPKPLAAPGHFRRDQPDLPTPPRSGLTPGCPPWASGRPFWNSKSSQTLGSSRPFYEWSQGCKDTCVIWIFALSYQGVVARWSLG